MPLGAGARLGPYQIVSPLGAGGMGEVYRARDPRLGRDVAIKILSDAARLNPELLRRFEREARAIAALSHPNIVSVFDVGAGEAPFLVTELLEGETLRATVNRGPLPATRSVDIALQLVSGLAAAHARGIVHRDLKPENVFTTADGRVKILDFGLARDIGPLDDEAITRPHTMQGTLMGTLGYMAPEQVRGLEAGPLADIFACGAILYELLTGRSAFRGPSPADTIGAVLGEPPDALVFDSSTPPALAAVVRRCLEKDPSRRFQSAGELAAALASISGIGAEAAAAAPVAVGGTSIAVLPFFNRSGDPQDQYFSDGLAEELINGLGRLPGLRVASATSSFRFRAQGADVREIGRQLGVETVLEGSVRRAGDRLRISARLTGTGDGFLVWSERYDREMADVFSVQDDIVEAIVTALSPALAVKSRGAARRPTENLKAYEWYLRGRHLWNQRSPVVVGEAIRCFEQAIALDGGYALAYSGLADCYSLLRVYGWTPPEHSRPRASDAVSHALALDPSLPEAHFSMALYTFFFEPHWRSARRHFLEALALNPRHALFEAYWGLFLATEYDHAEARRHVERALELDPHSSVIHFLVASTACAMDDAATAERHAARALELQPESLGARWPRTVAFLRLGRTDDALAVGEQVVARTRAPIYIGVLGMVYARAGRLDDARRLAQELDERRDRGEYIVPAAPLSIQLGLGDRPGIRDALARCVEGGGAAPFSVIATGRWLLDRHRDDAEIERLLDRLHDGAPPPRT